MSKGAKPPEIQELLRVSDRISFLYLEHAVLERADSALVARDAAGTLHVPIAAIACLLLGPGTTVTHQAVTLLAESGTSTVWVGENAVRYYAHGRPIGRNSRLLEVQARLVSSSATRLEVAKRMYEMRFGGEDFAALSIQQLRGKEGRRVRDIYRANAERTGVRWDGRRYDPTDFGSSDPVNMALSAATTALYGLCQAVIVALGCAPGLGFIHTGNDRSFVYDIADLYKAELAIPAAFDVAKDEPPDAAGVTRRRMRDLFYETRLLERVSKDVLSLLVPEESSDDYEDVVVALWGPDANSAAGKNYGDSPWS